MCDVIFEKTNVLYCVIDNKNVLTSINNQIKFGSNSKLSKDFIESHCDDVFGVQLLASNTEYIVKKVFPLIKDDKVIGNIVVTDTDLTTTLSMDNEKIIKVLAKFVCSIEIN